jgi:prevent-host-death family protein
MPNLTADQLDEYLAISGASINVGEAKNRLSQLVSELTPDQPVLINVRNKPRAAIVDIGAYRDLLARAEAYEHMRLADEAEAGERLPLDEAFAELDRRAATRRAARAQKKEAA